MTCLLGQRTAELHRMLAGNHTDPAFAREPLGKLYQRSMYQSMRNLTGRLCDRLSGALDILPESVRPLAKEIVRRRIRSSIAFELSSTRRSAACEFAAMATTIWRSCSTPVKTSWSSTSKVTPTAPSEDDA